MNSLTKMARATPNPGSLPQFDIGAVGKIATMSQSLASATVSAGRAQRVQTIATAQARVASRWREQDDVRSRRWQVGASVAGLVGFCLEASTFVPTLVPWQYLSTIGIAGLLCLCAPIVLAIRMSVSQDASHATELAVVAGQCRLLAALGDALGKNIDQLRGKDGLDPLHLQCLDPMLLYLERRSEQVAKSMQARAGGANNQRRHERIMPKHKRVVVRTADGRSLIGDISDLSISGVSLSIPLPHLPPGHEVTVGSRPAKVVRVWAHGIAFAFRTPLDASIFDENTVL